MPFTGPKQDRDAIRELYDSYADATCCADRNAWLACFTPDAGWWSHYFDISGIDTIAAQYDQLMANTATSIFTGQVLSIEVAGDTAHCRALCSERLLFRPGGEHRLTGLYHDDLIRSADGWRFARRVYKVMSEEMMAA